MILLALFIGAILIVAAIRNSQDALFSALAQDVPPFVVWAAAIFAVGALGFVPALKPVSRGLLALVITVLILNNWKGIVAGFSSAATDTSGAATDQAAGVTKNAPAAGKGGVNGLLHLALNVGAAANGTDLSSAAIASALEAA